MHYEKLNKSRRNAKTLYFEQDNKNITEFKGVKITSTLLLMKFKYKLFDWHAICFGCISI